MKAEDLWRMSRDELAREMSRGAPVDPEALADREYRGVSLGLGSLVERLTWKTFKKVFCRDADGSLRGWNVRIEQAGVSGPYVPKKKGGAPWTFGHYAVVASADGIVLDYGRYARRLDPMRFVRDPLVSVRRGDATLLLGSTILELPTGRLATPSYFTLELDGPLSRREPPPS
jgi:hypothetical protein